MPVWVSRAMRLVILLAGYAALWGVVHAVGVYVVPHVDGLDRAVSLWLNPDASHPLFDPFFRAYTDYANTVLALPLISLAVAVGIFRLTQLTAPGAWGWAGVSCVLWWAALGLFRLLVDVPLQALLILGALAPILMLLGAVPPRLFRKLDARRWITTLLCVETALFFFLWVSRRLWWNAGLPSANFLFIMVLFIALLGITWAFSRCDQAALSRFTRVFWLVLLTVVMAATIATNNIKEDIARPRPLAEANAPWNEGLRIIPEEVLRGHSSFPSGHTSGTFALITPLFWWTRRRSLRAAWLGAGVLQAVSRVYTVAHFTSDVFMGAVLGFGTGTLVFFLLGGPGLRAPDVPEPADA